MGARSSPSASFPSPVRPRPMEATCGIRIGRTGDPKNVVGTGRHLIAPETVASLPAARREGGSAAAWPRFPGSRNGGRRGRDRPRRTPGLMNRLPHDPRGSRTRPDKVAVSPLRRAAFSDRSDPEGSLYRHRGVDFAAFRTMLPRNMEAGGERSLDHVRPA